MHNIVQFISLICYVLYVLLWINYWLWFEIWKSFSFHLIQRKKCPNISGIWLVLLLKYATPFGISKNLFLKKFIIFFVFQQGDNKSDNKGDNKSDNKDIYNVTNYLYF